MKHTEKYNDFLLQKAREDEAAGENDQAIEIYQELIEKLPSWSVPHYNLGLIYKYQSDWELSLQHNQKATELDPTDQAAIWNSGIAATALGKWRTARLAWKAFGIEMEISDEAINMEIGLTPVRINPNTDAEVVWCHRICPARTVIESIPFPESGKRYGDVLLNDGAPVGYRMVGERQLPVFNELQLLEKSTYKTYVADIKVVEESQMEQLVQMLNLNKIPNENWTTNTAVICKECSEGIPHEHKAGEPIEQEFTGVYWIGVAANDKQKVESILEEWGRMSKGEVVNFECLLE